jgi:hypothetical protein
VANKSFKEELVEIGQYWCFRAKCSEARPWYFRMLAALCRRCGQ